MRSNHHIPSAMCLEIAPLLPVLDDAGLERDPHRLQAAREHARSCAYCQAELRAYVALDGELRRRFTSMTYPADAMEDIMQTIKQRDAANHPPKTPSSESTDTPHRSRGIFSGVVAVAAVVLIAVFAQALFHYGGNNAARGPLVISLPGTKGIFAGVSMVSPTEGWAIGAISQTPSGEVPQNDATLYHYKNGVWSPVLVPVGVPKTRGVFYGSISMDSASDGWAAGSNNRGGVFVLHYTGGRWNQVPAPSQSDVGRIQALSPTSVWLSTRFGGSHPPTIYHFDGETWNSQNLLSLGGLQIISVTDFQMVSASEGWAVASVSTATASDGGIAFLHYRNGVWSLAYSVLGNITAEPDHLAFSSPDDGWANASEIVPVNGNTYRVPLKQLVYHYTNGQWHAASLPLAQSDDVMLDALAMPSASEGWMGGIDHSSLSGDTTTNFSQNIVLLHYVHGSWQRTSSPQSGATNDAILSFSFPSPEDGWAVGYESNIPAGDTVTDTDILARAQPLLLHYHDGAWTIYQQAG